MATPAQFIVSALYVTFTYACIGFGALYFRTVVDRLRVREIRIGEELFSFIDPRVYFGIGCLAFFFCIFVLLLTYQVDLYHEEVNRAAPGLVFFVIPQVLVVNMIQLYLRARGQRTQICTRGILIRRMLSERLYAVPFQSAVPVLRVEREFWWFKMVFTDEDGHEVSPCYVGPRMIGRVVSHMRDSQGYAVVSDDLQLDGPVH
ncbi:MAG: hypothetical protein ACKOAX_03970 [Candidatus Kapaibacterium sp.]